MNIDTTDLLTREDIMKIKATFSTPSNGKKAAFYPKTVLDVLRYNPDKNNTLSMNDLAKCKSLSEPTLYKLLHQFDLKQSCPQGTKGQYSRYPKNVLKILKMVNPKNIKKTADKGVFYNTETKTYLSILTYHNQKYYIGQFPTFKEAKANYQKHNTYLIDYITNLQYICLYETANTPALHDKTNPNISGETILK